jgi:hypothetical protein
VGPQPAHRQRHDRDEQQHGRGGDDGDGVDHSGNTIRRPRRLRKYDARLRGPLKGAPYG